MAEKTQQTQEETQQEVQLTQEELQEALQTSPINYNRRNRRWMLKQQGLLRYLSKLDFLGEVRTSFRAQNAEQGRKIHQQNLDLLEKQRAEQLEAKLESMKATWTSMGYNAEELVKLEEAWTLSTVRSSDPQERKEEKKTIKRLQREVRESRVARKTN